MLEAVVKFRLTLIWPSLVVLLFSSAAARAQAAPAAMKPLTMQAGGGFSYARPDFGVSYVKGFSAYADALYNHRFGAEVNVHYNSLLTPNHVGENTYMIGPIVSLIHQDRMNVYVRAMGGIARFQYKPDFPNPHSESYGAYALGGGIEFRATKRINLRPIDIEEQWWPGFANHGLSPFVATFGGAYRF